MMKRKILAVTIPVVGCITVVGSGFSAWYFDAAVSGSDGLSASLNTHVTEKIDSMGEGVLTFTGSNKDEALNNKYLILDQGGMNNDKETVGIMIADDEVNAVQDLSRKYSFTVQFNGSTSLTLDKIYDAHMKLSVSVEIELKDKLPEYVTLTKDAKMTVSYPELYGLPSEGVPFTNTNSKWTATYTLDAEKHSALFDKDISQIALTLEIDLSTETLENKLFKYVDDKKPTDEGTYNKMVNDLGLGDVGTPATLGFVTTAKIGTGA